MPNLSDRVTLVPASYSLETVQTAPYSGAVQYTSVSTYPSTRRRTTVNRQGVNTPGFNNPNRVGLLPVNNFSYSFVDEKRHTGSYREQKGHTTYDNGYIRTVTGCLGEQARSGGSNITSGMISAARRKLVGRLLERVADQKANLLVTFAERHRTMELIADGLIKLTRAKKSVGRGNLVQAAADLGVSPRSRHGGLTKDNVARSWLELQYGWKPVLSDIHGVAEAYLKFLHGRPDYERAVVSERLSSNLTSYFSRDQTRNIYESIAASTVEMEFRMGATFKKAGGNNLAATLTELGILNPMEILWEMLPWSFVVDWFLPIGDFVQQMGATHGVEFVQGFETTFEKQVHRELRTYLPDHSLGIGRVGSTSASTEIVSVQRGKLASFPRPYLPTIKNPYSDTRFLNALALFQTNFRKSSQ